VGTTVPWVPSGSLKAWFVASVVVMAGHKWECWVTEEWLESPFFQRLIERGLGRDDDPQNAVGELVFLVFVFWLFSGLVMGAFVAWGGRAAQLAFAVWGLTFLLEFHHPFKAFDRGGYYPGLYTALVYLSLGPFYWRALLRGVPSSGGR
jgi:Protein of unknown function with HXXEE motif